VHAVPWPRYCAALGWMKVSLGETAAVGRYCPGDTDADMLDVIRGCV
jgi:hypothetical protein